MRRSRGLRLFTTRPPMRMSPDVGVSSPAIIRKRVVFPGARQVGGRPETRLREFPGSRRSLTPSCPSLNTFVRFRVSTTAIGAPYSYFHLAKIRLYSSSAALAAFSAVSSPRATLANRAGITHAFKPADVSGVTGKARGPGHVRAGPRIAPWRSVQAMPDRDGHQLVPGRVELHLIDAVAKAVVAPQHRGMLVGLPPTPAPGPSRPGGRAPGCHPRPSLRPRGAMHRASRGPRRRRTRSMGAAG